MKRTKIGSIENNIIYVEPNYFNSIEEYDKVGLNTYELAPPLEDYSIFVNLEVETRGRNVQSSKSSNNRKLILSFISKTDGTSAVNFMQGTKIPIGDNGATINSLTTNYTDIFLGDLKKNGPSTETFGIESIDISYNSYMVPEVTIEFVDVRGVALFAQKELYETNKNIDAAISSGNKEDIANTFFQCFFTFPYPKFTLLVKGFYGQPVSYELTCADFRARFDSKTGNFACTAKFVGYHFSFLNDVMMNGIVAAPYSDYIGSDYWKERNFKIKGVSGGDIEMPKIGWLLNKMKEIESTANRIAQSDPSAQEKTELDSKNERYQEVERSYNAFANSIKNVVSNKIKQDNLFYSINTDNGVLRAAIILSPTDNSDEFEDYFEDKTESIKKAYESFEKSLDEYNNQFPSEKLPKPDKFYDSVPKRRIWSEPNDEKKAYVNGIGNDDIKNQGYYSLFDSFKIGVNNGNLENINPLLSYKSVYFYKDNRFARTLEEYKTKNSEETKKVEKKIENLKDETIAQALRFRPTVSNMTKILMAHFETFSRMILKTAETICNENPSRTISSLGVSDARDFSDISNKDKNGDMVVPPFPKVVTEVKRNGSTYREEAWVGDYSGDFREKDLIHGIINGVKEVSKDILNYESTGNTGSNGGSDTPKTAIMKYPLTPMDMVADAKPYATDGYDKNDTSSILGLAGLRAINIFGTTNFKDWGKNAKAVGMAEAYNFLDNNKLNKEIISKFSNISGASAVMMMKGDDSGSIKRPGDGAQPWPWRYKIKLGKDGIIASNGDLDICRMHNGGFAVPFQNLSWNKIKSDVAVSNGNTKASWSKEYINSKKIDNLVKTNLFTFDTNVNRFSLMAEEQLKDIEGIEYYRNIFLGECKYDKDKYEKIITNGSKIIAYIIENASGITPSDGSCMLPSSTKAFSDKSFEGGYNMNSFADEYPGNGGEGWIDKDGKSVKRKADDGFEKYLEEFNSMEFTFTEFPGVNNDLSILKRYVFDSGPGNSIFGQMLYYKQESIYSKALLFLASLGYAFDYKTIIEDYIIEDDITMCIIPLPSVMFIGGLLWSVNNKDKLNHYNTDEYEEEIELLLTLRKDIQKRFIEIFEKWVTTGVENDSLLLSFNEMRSGLELNLNRKDISYDEFFRLFPEVQDKNIIGKSGSITMINKSYSSVMDMLKTELSESFFRNYITIDEDVYGDSKDFTRGIRLGNRDGGPSTIHATKFALAGCVFSKNSKFFKEDSNTNINVNTGILEQFFDGFLNVIRQENVVEQSSDNQISQAKEPIDSNTDIKIGIYRYCKMLYDKWIAGLSDTDFEMLWTMNSFFENEDKYFHFIDSFYNEADFVPINLGHFCDQIVSCYRNDQYSLLSFLSNIYAKNKLLFLCIQNFTDLGKIENMQNMFDTVAYNEYWNIKRHPNFVVVYPYESSNYLADIKNSEYENDGFMINLPSSTDNRLPEPLTSRNANTGLKYNIPAFGVSYGKMYQSYFKDIDVSMDNPIVTEQSIKAQFAIACQNNTGEQTGDRAKLYTYGQDLYSIYSNNSYTCNVTMMGCAWVQPMMYFVLNNVPMFRGTYRIEKVTHHIEPGNMTTKFTGVRMSNVCTRIERNDSIRAKNDQSGNGEANGNAPDIMEKMASVDNDCPYKTYPLIVDDGNIELSSDESSNASQIMKMIMSRGYSKAQAAGIVGNMYYESSFKHKLNVCDSNNKWAGGLCMWNNNSLYWLIKNKPDKVSQPIPNGESMSCPTKWEKKTNESMPSASQQVKFLLDSIEMDSYLVKVKKVRQNLLTATNPNDAAYFFARDFENCSDCKEYDNDTVKIRRKMAEKFFNNYSEPNVPKIENNSDKHISDIANGFLHALNKTAASSSNDIEIGIDSNKSKGDVIWLTNGKKNAKFSTVLDMILSAYPDKVSNVNWILPGDGKNQNSVPAAYLVTVKEGNSSVNIKVTTENHPNTEIKPQNNNAAAGIHISKNNDSSGIHYDFCKALVKAYKSPSNELKKDTNNNIDDYNALFSDNNYKIQKCNDVLLEAGVTEYSDGGKENEIGYIGDWNVGLFVRKLHYWASNVCENREGESRQRTKMKKPCKPHDINCGCGWCTSAVNRALRDSGFGMKYWGGMPWDVYEKMKDGNDFVEIESSYNSSSKVEFPIRTTLNKGDICIMWKKGTRDENVKYYHTCAYDGSAWYSDFKQLTCNVYKGKTEVTMEWHLFRHK